MLLCDRSCILSAFKEAEPRKNSSSSSTMSSGRDGDGHGCTGPG